MIDLEMTWQQAAVTSGCLLAGAAVAARAGRGRLARTVAFGREAGIMVGLFALWQFAGSFSAAAPAAALNRAEWIWRAERAWHLPSEAALQHAFLPYPALAPASHPY